MSNSNYHFMASLDHDGSLHIKAGDKAGIVHEYNLARSIRGPKKLLISWHECPLMDAINAAMKQTGAKEYTLSYIGVEGDLPFDVRRKGSVMNKLVGV